MKKSLILLPLFALVLTGCTLGGSSKKGGGGKKSSTTSEEGGGGEESGAVDFDLTKGSHTAVLDFSVEDTGYSYPRAEADDTSAKDGNFGGMSWKIFHTYRGTYTDEETGPAYWLMMKDKDDWDKTSNAWFGNTKSLGSIESIEVVVRKGASAKKIYDLSVGDSAFDSAQSGGTAFDVDTKGTYSGSGKGFFAISTKKDTGKYKYNGQISKITVKYTIE